MSKTVQIRNIDDEVYAALRRQAKAAGISVPELLRREAERLAGGQEPPVPELTVHEWLERIKDLPKIDRDRDEMIKIWDELRGPWPEPDAGR